MTVPRFELRRVQVDADEGPGIFTVLAVPARNGLTRRRFLGICVAASALVVINRSALAMQSGAQGTVVERAATFALPKVLTMAGIFSSGADAGSVEKGYHLRIFSDLSFPDEAFVLGPEGLEEFVSQDDQGKPLVIGAGEPDRKPKDETNRVPHQFFVYRRKHFPHFDRTFEIPTRMLRRLRNSEGRAAALDRVEISIHRKPLREYLAGMSLDVVAAFLPGVPPADLARRAREVPPARRVEVLEIRFPRLIPAADAPRRVVNNVDISAAIRSTSNVVVLEGFADDDPDPIRRMLLKSGTTSDGVRAAGQFVQGHYETLRLVSQSGEMEGCTVRYTYMADDTVVAPDQDNPVREQWQLLDSLPFITHYRTWQSAKSELFRHMPQNRYLDFDAPEVGTDVSKKLDAKYAHLFRKLQQMFVRMHLARLRGTPFLEAVSARTLATLRYEPHLFFELWCMDPNIARIMGHLYPDVPGQQNRREPEIGVEYDYMVTTAWQEQSAQRVCYITQKVSAATTPPLVKPSALAGKQLEGFSSETGKLLHRVGIEWLMPPAESVLYGFFEPPLFDVRRVDSAGVSLMLTHYVDANPPGAPLGQRIFDVPAQTPMSPPTTAAQRALLPPQARLALEFLDALHSRDSTVALTAAHLAAYVEMQRTPFARFFKLPDPKPRFQDWVEVPGLSPKTYRYGVRAIDLFGRVSPWSDTVSVSVANVAAAPEAVALTAAIENDGSLRQDGITPAGLLHVSWRFNAHQAMSGAPVDHFNVCWALYDRSGPAPEIIVRAVYHDVLGREPTATELTAKSASVAAHQLTPRQLAVSLAATATSYKLGNPRRYFLWNPLKTNVAYRPPVPFKVVSDVALDAPGAWMLAGSMTSARVTPSANALRAERELFGASNRVIVIATDQSWWGHAPFVMAMPSYVSSNVVDMVELRTMRGGAAGTIYPVVSFEPGEVLRIGIVVPAPDGTDPGAAFIAASPGQAFHLRFTRLRSRLQWTQTVLPAHVLRLDDDSEAAEDGETEPEDPLIDREVVRLRLAQPLSVEITGRASWLTDHAVVKLTHAASTWRAELRDFAAITVSVDALHFGSVLAGAVPTGHSRTLAVEVRNAGSAALAFAGASASGAGFVLTDVPAVGDVPPDSSITVTCTFAPATVTSAVGTLTLSLSTEQLTLQLRGTGVATVTDEAPHPLEPTARTYLAEVALAQIVHEGPPAFPDSNPVPVFNAALIAALESGGAPVTFEIEPVPVRRIVIDRSSTDGTGETAQMVNSRGGEVSFLTVDERAVICEALSRPASVGNPGEGSRLSFLLRHTPRLPVRAEGPDPAHQCTFHHVYREDIPLGSIAGLPAPSSNARLAVAVSTHKVPAGSESVDAESLVSTPERLQLLEPPAVASVAPYVPLANWQDPFGTIVYASLPRTLDNQQVVHARLTLSLAQAGWDWEVFRAPEDALRAVVVERDLRPPVPAPYQADADFAPFHALATTVPATAAQRRQQRAARFTVLNGMTPEQRYKVLSTLVAAHWEDPTHNLKEAFKPVAVVPNGVTLYTEELRGIGAGSVFYALRAVRPGAAPGTLQRQSFRVVIPDSQPPHVPMVLGIRPGIRQATLEWVNDRSGSTSAYTIHRSLTSAATLLSDMSVVAQRSVSARNSATPAEHPPLSFDEIRRKVVSSGGAIAPFLPPEAIQSVKGVFPSRGFDLNALPLSNQSLTNFFVGTSRYDTNTHEIVGLSGAAVDGQPLKIVAAVLRVVAFESPVDVQNGTIALPLVSVIRGVYPALGYNAANTPPGRNVFVTTSEFGYQIIRNLADMKGTRVVIDAEARDTSRSVFSMTMDSERRIEIPFGSRVARVIGVYRLDDFDPSLAPDAQTAQNRFTAGSSYSAATQRISSIALPNGTAVIVVALREEEVVLDELRYQAIDVAPLVDANFARIVGIYEAARVPAGATVAQVTALPNLLAGAAHVDRTRASVAPTLARATPIIVVYDTIGGQQQALSVDARRIQFTDATLAGGGRVFYRVVAVNDVIGRGAPGPTAMTVASAPSTLLETEVRS